MCKRLLLAPGQFGFLLSAVLKRKYTIGRRSYCFVYVLEAFIGECENGERRLQASSITFFVLLLSDVRFFGTNTLTFIYLSVFSSPSFN